MFSVTHVVLCLRGYWRNFEHALFVPRKRHILCSAPCYVSLLVLKWCPLWNASPKLLELSLSPFFDPVPEADRGERELGLEFRQRRSSEKALVKSWHNLELIELTQSDSDMFYESTAGVNCLWVAGATECRVIRGLFIPCRSVIRVSWWLNF